MDSNTIQHIVKEATSRLTILLEEAKQAEIAKGKRDIEISKARAVLALFAPEGDPIISEPSTPDIQLPPPLPAFENPVITEFNYNSSQTWEERIKSYFKYKNKVLTISQIIEAFKPYNSDYSEAKLNGAVTNTVALMNKKGLLRVYDPGFKMRGFYYGNPLWFEGESLKEEHKPDLKEKLLW